MEFTFTNKVWEVKRRPNLFLLGFAIVVAFFQVCTIAFHLDYYLSPVIGIVIAILCAVIALIRTKGAYDMWDCSVQVTEHAVSACYYDAKGNIVKKVHITRDVMRAVQVSDELKSLRFIYLENGKENYEIWYIDDAKLIEYLSRNYEDKIQFMDRR